MRIGGIDEKIEIKDFNYFKLDFNYELRKAFENIQDKYVLNNKYKISIKQVKEALMKIYQEI